MKKTKRLISVLLSVILVISSFSMFGVTAFAQIETGNCGKNVKYSYNTSTRVLTISGTGPMTNHSPSDSSFADELGSIKKVIINEGVTGIGDYAFYGCGSLTNVSIGNSVTKIGDHAFDFCISLKKINIPSGVSSIGESVFYYCDELAEISVDTNNKSFKSVENILFSKDKTKLVCYPAKKTGKSYTVPKSVKTIATSAFAYNRYLTNIKTSNNLKTIEDNAFEWCENVTNISLGNSVSSIGAYAFYGCMNLKDIKIPNGVKEIKYLTLGACNKLKSITIPLSVKKIASENFDTTYAIKDVYYYGSKANWKKITKGSYNYYLTQAKIHYNSLSISCSNDSFVYDGKAKKANVTVKDSSGKISSSNYTVKYSNNVNVGKAKITITFKNKYKGTFNKYYTINPKNTSIKNLSAIKGGFEVSIKKYTTQTTGYQIRYSTASNMSNSSKCTIPSNETTSKTISDLKKGKKYYVQVRTFKTVDGTKYYSSWSKSKSVTTKK